VTEAARSGIPPLPISLLIRNRRREPALSQEDRQLVIPQGSISKLERSICGDQHALRISAALGIEVNTTAKKPPCPCLTIQTAQPRSRHMMRRVDGFAWGLGLDEAARRQIVEKIAAQTPDQSDERLDAAR
jgi:hypothetical protein